MFLPLHCIWVQVPVATLLNSLHLLHFRFLTAVEGAPLLLLLFSFLWLVWILSFTLHPTPLQDVSRGSPSFWLCLTGVKLSPVGSTTVQHWGVPTNWLWTLPGPPALEGFHWCICSSGQPFCTPVPFSSQFPGELEGARPQTWCHPQSPCALYCSWDDVLPLPCSSQQIFPCKSPQSSIHSMLERDTETNFFFPQALVWCDALGLRCVCVCMTNLWSDLQHAMIGAWGPDSDPRSEPSNPKHLT